MAEDEKVPAVIRAIDEIELVCDLGTPDCTKTPSWGGTMTHVGGAEVCGVQFFCTPCRKRFEQWVKHHLGQSQTAMLTCKAHEQQLRFPPRWAEL